MPTEHPLQIVNTSIYFGNYVVSPEELASAFGSYLKVSTRTASTLMIEQRASVQESRDFSDGDGLTALIQDVCWWGGYSGIGGCVLKRNTPDHIRAAFRGARGALTRADADTLTAIQQLCRLNGFGLSFASKHLRMLWPQQCPVLDSVLHEHLGYDMTAEGYARFAEDCRDVARLLDNLHVPNPVRMAGTTWYVADVEASVFTWVNGWYVPVSSSGNMVSQ